MTSFLICLAAILAIIIVVFLTWFLSYRAEGKCPACAMKHLGRGKLTIDIKDEPNYDNNVSATPIMGWSSWNLLRNHIDEESIYDTAKAMADCGLAEAGYQYINIDDCWQSSMRDADGKLQGDLEAFPSGIDELCKKVNALGLKFGIYSSNGTLTCEDMPASLGNEELDAKTFASWGIEYVKYDFCHNQKLTGSTPIIEFADISKPGERSEIRLRPDHAKYTGKAREVKCDELPSKRGMGLINHGAGTASFNVDVPYGGKYIMTIHYHKAIVHGRQYLQVVVNGRVYEVHMPKGFSMSHDAKVQLEIQLDSGSNKITFQNPVVTMADSSYIQYKRMGEALKDASKAWAQYTKTEEKPITFSICEWGFAHPWHWGRKAGNMWRTTIDITPKWSRIKAIYHKSVDLYKYAGPAHVNDPDMLEVGNGKLTPDENRAHFALWCMMAAPLVLGNDLRRLTDGSSQSRFLIDTVTNKSLILIDQDPLVKAAKRIKKSPALDILARPLANGDTALCFFNKSGREKPIEFELDSLKEYKYLNFQRAPGNYEIHDLWSDDRYADTKITATVPKHGVAVYRISQ
ncbi:MAG: alpha-galactosidase [Ruminococcaceae bacterium]|nr:alpha-galactosidase [Oscillospiraceae bacterium]